ncbi:unnamed protein product [Paramecium sonneborni]|uniref:JmjC domain-containing protein n=1 Tax=Paramecium sonneborni TaxID=65129 RepID=A0A8S1R3T5_9CILI|nr:unnamed protein product [Paramecium sonneborni]
MIHSSKNTKKSKKQKNCDDFTDSHSKLLLERFPYTINDFQLKDVPVLKIDRCFFADPFKTIDELYTKGYEKFGIVKLILPSDLIVPNKKFFTLLETKLKGKRMQTRIQTLNTERAGEIFGSNTVGFTIQEYMNLANRFECNHRLQGLREVSNQIRQNEIEFWSIIDYPTRYEDIEVEYAADLLATKYATGFQEGQLGNLNRINKNRNSIFQVLQEKNEMSGISVPWLYLGMKYANFCWHKEDLNLNSMNYMHAGAAKTWYAIPPSYSDKFLQYFNQAFENERKSNPHLLYDITCQISPIELIENGIPILRTDQQPGELILTLGATYHAGFSHGFNCSEAVNVAPTQWLKEFDKAIQEYRMNGNLKKVSFPLEWLLCKVILMSEVVKFTQQSWQKLFEKFKQMMELEISNRNFILNLYDNVKLIEFVNKQEKYDRSVCKICSNYMFLSYIFCGKCIKKVCICHQSICACATPQISLYIRYSNIELQTMLATLESKLKTTGS